MRFKILVLFCSVSWPTQGAELNVCNLMELQSNSSIEPTVVATTMGINTDAVKMIDEVFKSNEEKNSWFLLRGVAPKEAKLTLLKQYSGILKESGRNQGRAHYGISDRSVTPAFILKKKSGEALSASEIFYVFKDAEYYANSGAAMETYTETMHKQTSDDGLATFVFPDARGFLLIYKISSIDHFEFHPESNTFAPHLVVNLPEQARVVGLIPLPKEKIELNETTGLPHLGP